MWFACGCLLCAPFAAGAAEPELYALHHSGPSECPGETWLRREVESRVGRIAFDDAAPTQAATTVRCGSRGCEATLALSGLNQQTRTHVLTAPRGQCRELMDSLALALALAVEPRLLLRAPAPSPGPVIAPEVLAQPPPPAAVVSPKAGGSPPADPFRPVALRALLTGHGSLGVSPRATGGASVGLGLQVSWFSVIAEARYDAPRSVERERGLITSSLWLASLVPCFNVHGVGFCGQGSVGAFEVFSTLPEGKNSTVPVALAGGRVQYEHMLLSWFGVHVHLGVAAVLTPVTVVADEMPVWQMWAATGDLSAGLTLRF